jgi:Tat protein secretion system quality control protein TatD with DNase activity
MTKEADSCVRELAEVVVQVKGCPLEELSMATCATAKSFFSKSG